METILTFGYMLIAWVTCASTFVILLGKLSERERRVKVPRASVAIVLVLAVLTSVLFGMVWPAYHVVSMTAQAIAAGKKVEKGEGK